MSTPNYDVRSVVHQLLDNFDLTPGSTINGTAYQYCVHLTNVLDLLRLVDMPGSVFAAATNDEKGYAFDALSELVSELRYLLENYDMPAGYEKHYEVPMLPMYSYGYLKQRPQLVRVKRPRWLIPATIVWAVVTALWLTGYLLGW